VDSLAQWVELVQWRFGALLSNLFCNFADYGSFRRIPLVAFAALRNRRVQAETAIYDHGQLPAQQQLICALRRRGRANPISRYMQMKGKETLIRILYAGSPPSLQKKQPFGVVNRF
jgi:hypothetical protein